MYCLTSLFFSLILQIAFICLMDQNNLLPNIALDICCKFIFISCKLLFYKSQINVSKCFFNSYLLLMYNGILIL